MTHLHGGFMTQDEEFVYNMLINSEIEMKHLLEQRKCLLTSPINQLSTSFLIQSQQIDNRINYLNERIRFARNYFGLNESNVVEEAERIANSYNKN